VSGAAPCSRRRAIILLARALAGGLTRAAALMPLLGALAPRYAALGGGKVSGLDAATIVALHLDQLARCGPGGTACAARVRTRLLAAARRHRGPPGPQAADAAFAIMEHIGEFPPVHGPFGGSQ